MGPYGPGKADDKPFLHKNAQTATYYLSWGCFYATSKVLTAVLQDPSLNMWNSLSKSLLFILKYSLERRCTGHTRTEGA